MASRTIISSSVRPWVLIRPGTKEQERGKIHGRVPHLLERGSHRTRPHCAATSTTDSWSGYGHPALWRCDKTHTRDRGERWPESSTAAAACSGAARYW